MATGETVADSHDPDYEQDSLHILPLRIVPLDSPSLARARLIKNVRLESAVELFRGDQTGSGQVDPNKLARIFEWPEGGRHPDARRIKALASLPSFDIYTLRIELRRLDIPVDEHAHLRLSQQKRVELTRYMIGFTRPLLQFVYGNEMTTVGDVGDLIRLFENPNQEDALQKLRQMTEKLQIGLSDLPRFLEDYGDVFLSLAYYRDCRDRLLPQLDQLEQSITGLRDSLQLRRDPRIMENVTFMERQFAFVRAVVQRRFDSFERHSETMWENITADSFRRVKDIVQSNHTTIGGILCGLSVKLKGWEEQFGEREAGPVRKAAFMISDLKQGMERFREIEEKAPTIQM